MEFEPIELVIESSTIGWRSNVSVNTSPVGSFPAVEQTSRYFARMRPNRPSIALCWVICSYGFLVKSYWLLHFLVVLWNGTAVEAWPTIRLTKWPNWKLCKNMSTEKSSNLGMTSHVSLSVEPLRNEVKIVKSKLSMDHLGCGYLDVHARSL